MLFLIAQNKRFGTLNATQKTKALYKAPFWKKIRKNILNIVKNAFYVKNGQFLALFLIFFKNGALQRAAVFCVAFSVPYGQKVNQSRKKGFITSGAFGHGLLHSSPSLMMRSHVFPSCWIYSIICWTALSHLVQSRLSYKQRHSN